MALTDTVFAMDMVFDVLGTAIDGFGLGTVMFVQDSAIDIINAATSAADGWDWTQAWANWLFLQHWTFADIAAMDYEAVQWDGGVLKKF